MDVGLIVVGVFGQGKVGGLALYTGHTCPCDYLEVRLEAGLEGVEVDCELLAGGRIFDGLAIEDPGPEG